MSRFRSSTNANTTTTDGPDLVRLPVLRLRGDETAEQRRRREAEADEAALAAMRERLEQNRRRREEEEKQEAEERQRREEEERREEERRLVEERRAEEDRLQREAEERVEEAHRRKVREGKKRRAEEEEAGKAKKKTKHNTTTQTTPAESPSAGPSRIRSQNVGTGGDPSDDEYPGPDDGDDDDSSEASPAPSGGDDKSDEHRACARCHRLERDEFCVPQTRKNATACQPCHDNKVQCSWSGSVGAVSTRTGPGRKPKPRKAKTPIRGTDNSLRLSNLEDDIQGLKETFNDLANTQQEILDMLRENRAESSRQAHNTDARLRTIEATLDYLLEFFQVGEDNAPKETESEQDKEKKKKMEVIQVDSSDEEDSSD
ncbi:hypothetical protein EV360DRAFT_90763 [Lentinula raphanica]|nr:hypothetical protein EV360DRAFT_90763 [Lentinula raphanica]